jgi:hypothetical protein
MKRIRWILCPVLGLATLVGTCGLSGCGPEGEGSAPKLKGSKDEIQKASQSGVPGKPNAAKR